MRKQLTKAARCAIKMRSTESDKKAAVQKLQHDLHNSPLHCFGIHDNCSTDFCKVAQQRASESVNSTTTQDTNSDSISSPTTASTSTSSIRPVTSATHTDTNSESAALTETEDDSDSSLQAILTISQEQEDAWNDALDEADFDAIRSSPQAPVQADPRMLCDIQRVIGRLVSKSEQLLGKTKIIIQHLLAPRYIATPAKPITGQYSIPNISTNPSVYNRQLDKPITLSLVYVCKVITPCTGSACTQSAYCYITTISIMQCMYICIIL